MLYNLLYLGGYVLTCLFVYSILRIKLVFRFFAFSLFLAIGLENVSNVVTYSLTF